jgi:hypothetical protein
MGIKNGTAEAANGTSPDTPSFDFAHFDVHRKGRFSPTLVDAPVNKKNTFATGSQLFLGGIGMDYHLCVSLWSWYYSIDV